VLSLNFGGHAGSGCTIWYHIEVGANTQLLLQIQDAQEAAKHMNSLLRPEITVNSVLQGAQENLDAVDNSEDTYLQLLKIFNVVIREIADVCM
jgi:hypothetical protein